MEFINTRKIIKKERFESFNVTDFSKNDDVVSFLTTQDDGQRFLLIYNNSNNCQNIYIDFTGTNFLLTDYIKSYKNYMFYDLISDGIVLRAGNEILNNKKKALQFKILENGIICFKVFEFYAMKEQSKIKLENIENIFNRFSFLLMEKGLNFKNEIIFELKKNNNKPREKDLLKLIESFLSRFSRDINFYYENEDSYKTVFANIPETSKNNEEQLIFILNENNDQNFKFLKSEIFSLKCDNDITKKVFFIFEDLFTKEIFIRYGCELQQNGLAIKLTENEQEAHLFRIKRVIDNDIELFAMLFEQVGYKSIKSNDFFEKIFENKDEFVLIDTIVKKENYKQNGVNWVAQNLPELVNKNIVYLCMEMFIPELYYMNENVEYNGAADANFSGGLGILAGCTMEGFADIGLNSCAIVPMYRKRRVQKINTALGQTIFEEEIDYSKNKYLKEFIDEETGEQLEIQVFVDHKKYNVKIWEISRGGTKIYLLQETEIFDILYTGNREQRLKQEVLFGKVVPILLKTLNIKPDILHLNEAHPIIAAVQMKDWKNISNGDNFFEDTRILFTIHTPRTAGMEIYFVNFNKLEIPYYFKPIFDKNNSGKLDFTNAAIELSDRVNTVSNNQIRIVKERIFTDEKYHRKIIGIINGSSKSFWTSELNKEFYDKNDTDILCSDIWQIHKKNKQKAIEYIKNVFSRENIKSTLDLKSDFYLNLSIKKPSAWAIRRIVDYKNQWPLLKDIIRIICAEKGTFIDSIYGRQEGLGFQVVVGGMAHPSDHNSQQWINEFVHWMKGYWRDDISKEFVQAPELIGNFFFLPSFNEGLGRTLKISAIGCDVCLEIPMWDEEACGTSGMRALGNGNICIDSSDGALEWLEDGKNSFLLKPYEPNKILEFMQRISCMYNDLLEKEIKGENLEDDEFLNMKKQAIITWERIINIDIMAQRYANEMFYPVIKVNDLIRK